MSDKEDKKEVQDPLGEELKETKNKLLRALADLDNYKKRAAAEKEDFARFANENLITALIPILDAFDRAMQTDGADDKFLKGFALIKKMFEDTLEKFGVKEIDAMGKPFDPQYFEAIMKHDSDKPENTVIEVAQKGYTLNGKVIKPAMVIVSSGKNK